ncbi:hypothetical protein G5B00_15575 [Parapedobacter sp. SGR-10]|uniref:alginate lyase family protein n=1 Tax=Parapedobacter sp. SGR-10 TaxID=2710879 RepID=UPI0013D80005|nr:alginate lyase family protein [Parapedobacter sp. SGR-10]NGF57939.1 hypothetical protein [Parapedobacter sp. SGR-10]
MMLYKKAIMIAIVAVTPILVQAQTSSKSNAEKPRFVHPGIIGNTSMLDAIQKEVDAGKTDRIKAYQQVLDFIENNPIQREFPEIVMAKGSGSTPTEAHIRRDAILAYAYALKWARTGKTEDAAKAIEILNGWASNFQKYEPVEGTSKQQSQLEAAWVAPSFVAAAEIIRHYKVNGKSADWLSADRAVFNKFVQNLKDNYINAMVKSINNNRRRNNWGVSAGYAKMAIGVYLGSKNVYEDGKRIILELLPHIIQPDGEILEFCSRDCHHPQYSMCGLTLAAEIAKNQGDSSIYEAISARLKTGWEWMGTAYNGQADCRNCAKARLFSAIEVANSHYKSDIIQNLIAKKSPFSVNKSHTFLDFFTYTHHSIPK